MVSALGFTAGENDSLNELIIRPESPSYLCFSSPTAPLNKQIHFQTDWPRGKYFIQASSHQAMQNLSQSLKI